MSDNEEFLAEDEGFPDYTDQETDAMHQAIKPNFKADGDFHRIILFSIVQVLDAVSGGGVAHPHHMLYAGENQRGP